MSRQEAEQLAGCIRSEAGKLIEVLGVEPLGLPASSYSKTEFFVKCSCKKTGLRFAVKSPEHWEYLKQHVLVRICKLLYRLIRPMIEPARV